MRCAIEGEQRIDEEFRGRRAPLSFYFIYSVIRRQEEGCDDFVAPVSVNSQDNAESAPSCPSWQSQGIIWNNLTDFSTSLFSHPFCYQNVAF